MTMLARIEANDIDADRRHGSRRLLKLAVPGSVPDRAGVDVLIHDLSHSGLLIETSAELAVGARLKVELPEAGTTDAAVMWGNGRYFGCRFDSPIAPRVLSAAQLMSAAREPAVAHAVAAGTAEESIERLPPAARAKVLVALAFGAWAVVLIPIVVAVRLIH